MFGEVFSSLARKDLSGMFHALGRLRRILRSFGVVERRLVLVTSRLHLKIQNFT